MTDFYQHFLKQYRSDLTRTRSINPRLSVRPILIRERVFLLFERLVGGLTRYLSRGRFEAVLMRKSSFFLDHIDDFEDAYGWLSDEDSRQRYVKYISFRAVKSRGLEMDVELLDFEQGLESAKACITEGNIVTKFTNLGNLSLFDLSKIGYDVHLLNSPLGVAIDFVAEQYAYKDICKTVEGDIVIDCGGATGDTAMYFAARGASKVYVFEFIDSNLKLIKQHLGLNPNVANKVVVVNAPVWEESAIELSFLDQGNASRVAEAGVYPNSVQTLSIDDMVGQKKVESVNFIKMDIEGAELPALKGAADTIRKHRPKLAICVYHKVDDLLEIPQYLKSLNPDYSFYFECYTTAGWEAVLYAIDEKIR